VGSRIRGGFGFRTGLSLGSAENCLG
jgi:hypothetical protein